MAAEELLPSLSVLGLISHTVIIKLSLYFAFQHFLIHFLASLALYFLFSPTLSLSLRHLSTPQLAQSLSQTRSLLHVAVEEQWFKGTVRARLLPRTPSHTPPSIPVSIHPSRVFLAPRPAPSLQQEGRKTSTECLIITLQLSQPESFCSFYKFSTWPCSRAIKHKNNSRWLFLDDKCSVQILKDLPLVTF